jgi:hypothetical protein
MKVIAPNRDGWPIHPRELDLPKTNLDPTSIYSYNNHHRFWPARHLGKFVIGQTLRDLEDSQVVLPKDVHKAYHDRYEPAPLPDLHEVMERLDDAYHAQELLRYGSAREPRYEVFSTELWEMVKKEYDERNMRMTS